MKGFNYETQRKIIVVRNPVKLPLNLLKPLNFLILPKIFTMKIYGKDHNPVNRINDSYYIEREMA